MEAKSLLVSSREVTSYENLETDFSSIAHKEEVNSRGGPFTKIRGVIFFSWAHGGMRLGKEKTENVFCLRTGSNPGALRSPTLLTKLYHWATAPTFAIKEVFV